MTDVNNAAEPLPTKNDERWAHRLVAELAVATLAEKRRARRWGIFFKLLFLLYLVIVTLLVFYPLKVDEVGIGQHHTALVSVDGLIASGTKANAENIISGLRAAFKDDKTAGVILRINSPGGSPVQAGEVYDEIMHLRKAHPDVPEPYGDVIKRLFERTKDGVDGTDFPDPLVLFCNEYLKKKKSFSLLRMPNCMATTLYTPWRHILVRFSA